MPSHIIEPPCFIRNPSKPNAEKQKIALVLSFRCLIFVLVVIVWEISKNQMINDSFKRVNSATRNLRTTRSVNWSKPEFLSQNWQVFGQPLIFFQQFKQTNELVALTYPEKIIAN